MRNKPRNKNNILSAAFRTCFLAFVAIVVGVNIYLWNAQGLVGNAMPMPFGIGSAVVLSGSMEPTLKVDDLIFVREKNEYQVNDIVVFQDGASLTVHRLISIDGETAITKGDANNIADGPIPSDRIIGVVCLRVPFIGKVARVLKTPVGIAILLTLAILLVEISYHNEKKDGNDQINQLKEEIRKLRQEQDEENK